MYAVRARLEDAEEPPVGLFSPLLPLSAPPEAAKGNNKLEGEKKSETEIKFDFFFSKGSINGSERENLTEIKQENSDEKA